MGRGKLVGLRHYLWFMMGVILVILLILITVIVSDFVVLIQFILIKNSWFVHNLGPSSYFVVRLGHVGINLVPVMINVSILVILILTGRSSLTGLSRELPYVVASSVVITLVAVMFYAYIIHDVGNYELTGSVIFRAQVFEATAVLLMCSRGRGCPLMRTVTLIYIGVLITGYLNDAFISVMMSRLAPVVGGFGPVDGLVVYSVLITLLFASLFLKGIIKV